MGSFHRYNNHDSMEVAEKVQLVPLQLLSPPEQVDSSFSSQDMGKPASAIQKPPIGTLSPPVSPEERPHTSFSSSTSQWPSQDQPLFAQTDTPRSQVPLFESDSRPSSSHQDDAPASQPQISPSDTRIVFDWDRKDLVRLGVHRYMLKVMAENKQIQQSIAERERTKHLPPPKRTASTKLDDESRRQLHAVNQSTRVTKSKPLPKPVAKPKASAFTTSPVKSEISVRPATKRTPRSTPKERALHSFDDQASPGSAQSKHKRAPPSKKLDGEDAKWRQLTDFCPPIDSLKGLPKLKVSWGKSSLDITEETDYDQLHEDEAAAASELRLHPDQYMANKRRLFQAKVASLKANKPFNKTMAQNAMSIDVNKASKMWQMYDNVGWLDRKWFEQYL